MLGNREYKSDVFSMLMEEQGRCALRLCDLRKYDCGGEKVSFARKVLAYANCRVYNQ